MVFTSWSLCFPTSIIHYHESHTRDRYTHTYNRNNNTVFTPRDDHCRIFQMIFRLSEYLNCSAHLLANYRSSLVQAASHILFIWSFPTIPVGQLLGQLARRDHKVVSSQRRIFRLSVVWKGLIFTVIECFKNLKRFSNNKSSKQYTECQLRYICWFLLFHLKSESLGRTVQT